MAFDDSSTEPLIAAGCVAIVCGLLVPVILRLGAEWWTALLVIPPIAVLVWMARGRRASRAK